MLNFIILSCNSEPSGWLFLLLGFLLSIAWTWILYRLKPKLEIEKPDMNGDDVHVKIKNRGCFSAINIRIEVCVVRNNDKNTYHYNLDMNDFLILPRFNKENDKVSERVFKTNGLSDAIRVTTLEEVNDYLKENGSYLRVRIHGYHEFSGFGKAFEAKFSYNNGMFNKIPS